jgi:hypothetical protein
MQPLMIPAGQLTAYPMISKFRLRQVLVVVMKDGFPPENSL